MSQTLTKPILLDETGQAIAEKLDINSAAIVDALDDIKDAIGTSSEFIPVKIQVTTPPIKTSYLAGETLDLTGMVVNLIGTNGVQVDITNSCTFSPANGATLTAGTTSVSVSYYYPKDAYTFTTVQAISVRELLSISVSTAPTKTAYKTGETLDLTGINILAVYGDGYVESVTQDCVFSPVDGTVLDTNDSSVAISYTLSGITKTTTQAISVKEVSSIAITTAPTKTSYADGETLDLTGMVVTATYTDTSTENVTSNCTFSPANGTTLAVTDSAVTVTFVESGLTKTATQSITVSYPIYGVQWDGTATTAWTRTDMAADFTDPNPYYAGMTAAPSSPFDNIQPWAGMQIVEEQGVGKLVSIPKFYYKLTQQNEGVDLKIQISPTAMDGFSVSPAHMDRGDGVGERDVIYVGRYHNDTNYRSTAGSPKNSATISNARYYVREIDDQAGEYQLLDFATLFTIWLLYLVEFADWDSQKVIGFGCGNNTSTQTMGYTDNMTYHTGTTQTSRDTYGAGTQYRYIEGLWDNVSDFIDGCIPVLNEGLHIILKPADFADKTKGVNIGIFSGNFPSKFVVKNLTGLFPLFFPTEANGSDSTYTTDTGKTYYVISGSLDYSNVILHGGWYAQYKSLGMFNLHTGDDSNALDRDGSRLMKLPNS